MSKAESADEQSDERPDQRPDKEAGNQPRSGVGPIAVVLSIVYGALAAFIFAFSGALGTFGDLVWRDIALIVVTVCAAMALTFVSLLIRTFLRRRASEPGDPDDFSWHLMIPCRDEEAVIAATISAARTSFPFCHVWVIDDDSDDDTARIVREFMDFDVRVHLISRVRPNARTGKGDALNTAFRRVADYVGDDPDARHHAIIGVLDADGYLSDNALQLLSGPQAFGDDNVGAVQLEVWMKNRNDRQPRPGSGRYLNALGRYLVRMQDIEFRTSNTAMQLLRVQTGTVGMGGNGQFTRLTVLDEVAEQHGEPWGNKLSEDYELGLNILSLGHRSHYLREAHVSQEALPYFKRLLTQRTRWAQGIVQCAGNLPALRKSGSLRVPGTLEIFYFMSQPWLMMANLLLVPLLLVLAIVGHQAGFLSGAGAIIVGVAGLIFVVLPYALWGPMYRRWGKEQITRRFAVALGLGYLLYVYFTYLYYPRALGRLMTGRNSWAKTKRNAEEVRPAIPLPGAALDTVTLFEPAVVAGLAEDLESEAYAREVAGAYVVMWPTRLANLEQAVAADHAQHSYDAIASIRVSSAMIGAERLEKAAESFGSLLYEGDLESARLALPTLAEVGAQTVAEIRRTYLGEVDTRS